MTGEKVLERYLELVDELLWRRALDGQLSDEEEERFAEALDERWVMMTAEQHDLVEELIAKRRELAGKPSLNLVDAEPKETDEEPLRVRAATAA